MGKQKKTDRSKKPEKLPDLLKKGELFVKETYLRLHRKNLGMTTEDAENMLKEEIINGSVCMHHKRAEVQIYIKQ